MNISANLRRLRQKLDMTQEALAATICVSPQAVSKWERGEGLPDITLVPSIAFALGVTTDVLFGVNEALRKEQVQKIGNESARILFADMADASDWASLNPDGAADYIREKLRDYPDEWMLWTWLAHYLAAASHINTPEFDEAKYDEVIRIHERIASTAPELDDRLNGVFNLVVDHAAIGNYDRAEEAAKRLPRRARSYAEAARLFMRGAPLKKFLEEELFEAVSHTCSLVTSAVGGIHSDGMPVDRSHVGSREERLSLLEFAARVYELTRDFPWGGKLASGAASSYFNAAEMLMDEYGDIDSAFGYLERAAGCCEPIPGEKTARLSRGQEPFADGAEDYTPTDAARESLLGILNYANDIPKGATSAFTPVRDDPRFLAIIEKLKRRAL
ncbi:MAG: helix-turn-helix domain-containing protein [Oscillospiraceae bacterium]|jgi:transcriptional regulator with XRE-family HTH domain|nr:helix-turn-helix domain-containing protein [Oscillospiraceae bacterium]